MDGSRDPNYPRSQIPERGLKYPTEQKCFFILTQLLHEEGVKPAFLALRLLFRMRMAISWEKMIWRSCQEMQISRELIFLKQNVVNFRISDILIPK